MNRVLAGAILFGALAAFADPSWAQGSGSKTIDDIRARGQLVCGVTAGAAGFSLPDSRGVMRGIDADICRAVAAATLGEADKVRYVPTTVTNRFTALQSGEIDILVRSTTWTLSREANLGLEFAGVYFFDGTGFMVNKSLGVKSSKELNGATICIQPGTSTELAVADYFREHGMKFKPILIQDPAETQNTFISGRCDAYSMDISALASFRFQQGPKKDDYVLLPEVISKEPVGVMVRKGDEKFFDLVRWSMIALLQGEESGVTQANVDQMLDSKDPTIRRMLGLEGDLGKAMGVDNKWAYKILKSVGNFGEIWERNIAPLGISRGINALWTKGGLHYPPPMR
ncbi:amino acid ABC transporter substrate-binding protein [Methylobacterium nodulans]|uniref:Extracellular solute-binding protein family 3 n=1 Tax=Methylobacterium nodulans (strain LMG 21967 / CNCM I-2342 / ORS 2060) TaxID=460265 RepID=B8IXQ5_METNO|nr:amino acid ABC transporter substrate-binding protein [Methylobacterium nodulans]ACL62887.1 extracellular solute-binding protein family 3 [Methylobacterium nodulans ORS 2060]